MRMTPAAQGFLTAVVRMTAGYPSARGGADERRR